MNIKNILLSSLACFAMAGCVTTQPSPAELDLQGEAIMPTQKKAQEAVKTYFDSRLVDPESARYQFWPLTRGFSDFAVGERHAGVFMCGTINSKNRMGGYTGQTPFMAYFDPETGRDVQLAVLGDGGKELIVSGICQRTYAH